MREPGFRWVCACAVALVLAGAGCNAEEESAVKLEVGQQAPEFELAGSDGKTYKLSDLAGKTVVIAWFPKAFTGG